MSKEDDQFQVWLMNMNDAIDSFRQSIPTEVAARLDFSADSLSSIEGLALSNYNTIDDIKQLSEAKSVDGMARYVGQVFRKYFGGKWTIDFTDKNNAFYGLPQLVEMDGQRTQICPLTLITASVDRRTGIFIRTIFDNLQQSAMKASGTA